MFSKLIRIYNYDFTNIHFSKSIVRYLAVNLLILIVPLIVNQPQLLVGSIVNFLLIYIALNFKKSEFLPAIFLPSIASVLNGVLIGSLTPLLTILMPFIWISNAILVLSLRHYVIQKHRLTSSLALSGLFKVLTLSLISLIVVKAMDLPGTMIKVMSITQLFTFSIAASVYLVFSQIKNKNA